jgi:hypothetical protein
MSARVPHLESNAMNALVVECCVVLFQVLFQVLLIACGPMVEARFGGRRLKKKC